MLSKAKYPFSRYWSIFLTDSWKTPSAKQKSEATSYTTTDNHPAFPMPCKWAIDFPEVTWGYSVLRPRKFAGTVGTVKKWTAHKGEARPFPPNLGELLQPFAVERDMADAPMWWLNDIERRPPWPALLKAMPANLLAPPFLRWKHLADKHGMSTHSKILQRNHVWQVQIAKLQIDFCRVKCRGHFISATLKLMRSQLFELGS